MTQTAPLAAIILARRADAAALRAIAAAVAESAETAVVISSAAEAARLSLECPGIAVRHGAFRNAAEALQLADPRQPWRLWFWAEELPSERAWDFAKLAARQGSPGAFAFRLGEICDGWTVASAPADRPAVRLWHGSRLPIVTGTFGTAIADPTLEILRGAGVIVHDGYETASARVSRTDFELGCAVHAAIAGGTTPPAALAARSLLGNWFAAWLRSGRKGATRRMRKTFEHRFWQPLYLNARLREAAEEVARTDRKRWLDAHAHYSGTST